MPIKSIYLNYPENSLFMQIVALRAQIGRIEFALRNYRSAPLCFR
nr:MAG TPA: hypothetical protein [Inoviridae sp.]